MIGWYDGLDSLWEYLSTSHAHRDSTIDIFCLFDLHVVRMAYDKWQLCEADEEDAEKGAVRGLLTTTSFDHVRRLARELLAMHVHQDLSIEDVRKLMRGYARSGTTPLAES